MTPRPSDRSSRVLIVGAGPVGMTLACELLAAGHEPTIVSRPRAVTAHSRATILWPRILELLDRIGVAEDLIEVGHYFDQMNYYSEKRPTGRIRFDRLPGVQYPFAITCPQWKIEAALERRLQDLGGSIEYGTRFLSGTQSAHEVRCRLVDADGRAHDREFDWVVGADGYRSEVRDHFGIGFDGRELQTRLAITDAEVLGETTSSEAAYYLTRGGNMVLAPLGDGIFRVGTTVPAQWTDDRDPDKEFFEKLLAERVPGYRRLGEMRFSGIFTANIRSAATYRSGRVFLCGDAAHAMSPSGAQGLNTGLQDAVNLGWKLGGVARGVFPEQLLNSYDSDRRPAVHRVSRLSTSLAEIGLYDERPKIWARDIAYRVGSRTGLLEKYVAPHLAQATTYYGPKPEKNALTVGQRLPLTWRTSSAAPTLDRHRYTVLLWPGQTYPWEQWRTYTAQLQPKIAQTKTIDLAGRPPGALLTHLPTDAVALIVRPDGHLERVLQPQLDTSRWDASQHAIATAVAQLHDSPSEPSSAFHLDKEHSHV